MVLNFAIANVVILATYNYKNGIKILLFSKIGPLCFRFKNLSAPDTE